jgi:RNA polymerase sigma factor (sigma-70 family)
VDRAVEDQLRELAPQVLGALVRRYGQFDSCEDAVQEALIAASRQWPAEGVPGSPRGWLVTVASRRLVDGWRNEDARSRRERSAADQELRGPGEPVGEDDTLTLLVLCCHPELSEASRIGLTLRAVGGLTTAEIAAAFLVPEATMAQRISRAKQRLRGLQAPFALPAPAERDVRLRDVQRVLYLVFNEGYAASSGTDLRRADLAVEAIRLARTLHRLTPDDGEATGLLALMLLTDARRAARVDDDGWLVPLAEQDRTRWDAGQVREGLALLEGALGSSPPGPYQVQAAIAALHDQAATAADTDWPQILALYDALDRISPGPVVRLNRAVAVAMVRGPHAGLAELDDLDSRDDERLARGHRLDAVRAHLLELAGDRDGARAAYQRAARRTGSVQEQAYLSQRAAQLR